MLEIQCVTREGGLSDVGRGVAEHSSGNMADNSCTNDIVRRGSIHLTVERGGGVHIPP
jgi:hypothetical protein